jgi:hypothetical protein
MIAFYVQGLRLNAHDSFALDVDGEEVYPSEIDITKLASLKTAMKYNFLSPYKDGIGLSFAWELAYVF